MDCKYVTFNPFQNPHFHLCSQTVPSIPASNKQNLMQSLLRRLGRRRHHHHDTRRTLFDVASLKCVRDRGLDHAVEKEGNLKPLLNLKDLIKSQPSKSLPLSLIAQERETLGIAARPVEFIRRYPSVFQEFSPGGIGIHPHVKLAPEILSLDEEEILVYHTESNKLGVADRLLKLLMLSRINKIPLHIIDRLKWDLGLPQDYAKTIVPEFPDYFQVTGGGNLNPSDSCLELVCWSNELAVSVMEKKGMSAGYEKGMPIAFPLQYSRGFEVDKKFTKWVDGWQKLPYISPYENALHLPAKSDEGDKWAVAVLHELLNLLIPKKTERENVLLLGECLGLRSRFKRALLQHPGIFYLSSKIGTHTVVLREGYKRNLLIEKHPLMNMRYKYIHLMNTVKEDTKGKVLQSGSAQQQKLARDSKGEGEEVKDDGTGNVQDGESCDFTDSEVEDDSDDDFNDDEDEGRSRKFTHVNAVGDRRRRGRKTKYESKRPPLRSRNSLNGRYPTKTDDDNDDEDEDEGRSRKVTHVNAEGERGRRGRKTKYESKRPPSRSPNSLDGRYPRKTDDYNDDEDENYDRNRKVTHMNAEGDRGRRRRKTEYESRRPPLSLNSLDRRYPRKTDDYNDDDEKDYDRSRKVTHMNAEGDRGKRRRKTEYESKMPPSRSPNGSDGRYPRKSRHKEPTEVSRSTVMHRRRNIREQSPGRSEFSRNRGRSNLDKKASV